MSTQETVMVTGGTGYLGSWVVRELLEKGHTVRLTVRDLKDHAKVDHLLEIEKSAPGKLELREASLLQNGAYDKSARGCTSVVHMASPFTLQFKDAHKELIAPAIKGTQNVLQAASRSGTVKKIILTSSAAAIYGDNIDMKELGIEAFTEEQFNFSSSLTHQPYSYSKVSAEKQAWEIHDTQDQWRLIVLNPVLVMGPPLNKTSQSESLKLMKDLLGGKYRSGAPDLRFGFVDVRDVAKAHLIALENDRATGRFLLSECVMSILDFSKRIRKMYGKKYKLPKRKAPKLLVNLLAPTFNISRKFVERNVGHEIKFNSTKSREQLHLSYTPIEKTIKDMIDRMEELEMV